MHSRATRGGADRGAGRWELDTAEWAYAGRDKREALLLDGWEPFAVAGREVWFRRWVEASQDAEVA